VAVVRIVAESLVVNLQGEISTVLGSREQVREVWVDGMVW